jgi:hypothetical protein
MRSSISCLALLLAFAGSRASASTVFATWNSASGSTAAGSLGGVSFTVSGLTNPGLTTSNLSGGSFSANPGGSSQQSIHYAEKSNFTVTFSSPIPILYVYDYDWRPEDLADYNFGQAIEILSGNSNAAVVGGTSFDATNFNSFLNGIIELTNVTSFTVTQNSNDPSAQDLDFATQALAAPEPDSLALLTLGLVVAALLLPRRLRRSMAIVARR